MNEVIKKYITRLKSPKLLVIIGITGIMLIYLSTFFSTENEKSDTASGGGITVEQYREQLEESILKMVESITGSPNATVIITLESSMKYSYADISEGVSANKTESDSESFSSESKQTYITVKTSDGGEQALIITTEMPEVRGVAIVCEGGDDELICEKIQNAVMAALNITSKRVYIAGGISNEKR